MLEIAHRFKQEEEEDPFATHRQYRSSDRQISYVEPIRDTTKTPSLSSSKSSSTTIATSIMTAENDFLEDEIEQVQTDYVTSEKRLEEINSKIHEFLLEEANLNTASDHWSTGVDMNVLERLRDEHNDIEDHLEQLEMKMRQLQDINISRHSAVELCPSLLGDNGSSHHLYSDIDEEDEDDGGESFAGCDDHDCASSTSTEESWDKNCSLGRVVQEDDRRRGFHRSMSLPDFQLKRNQCSLADAFKAQQEAEKKKQKEALAQKSEQQEQPSPSKDAPSDLAPTTIDSMVTMLQRKTEETKQRTVKRRSSFNGDGGMFGGLNQSTPPITTTAPNASLLSSSCSARVQSTSSLHTLLSIATDSGTRPSTSQSSEPTTKRHYMARRPSLSVAVSSSMRIMNNIVDDVIVGRNEEGEVLVDFPSREADDTPHKQQQDGGIDPSSSHHYQPPTNHYHSDGHCDTESNCAEYGECDSASCTPTKSYTGSSDMSSPHHAQDGIEMTQEPQALSFFGLPGLSSSTNNSTYGGSSSSVNSKTKKSSKTKQKKMTALEESYMKRMAHMEATYTQELREKDIKIQQQQAAITTLETAATVQADTVTYLRETNDSLVEELKRMNAKLEALQGKKAETHQAQGQGQPRRASRRRSVN